MVAFIDFLGFLNQQLRTRDLPRIEMLMMPANFSSLVGEFIVSSIPKYCPGLVKNRYHNGHPDLLPQGRYPDDLVLHGPAGIEVKASRYPGGWQGHNAEECWLMVFVFKSTAPRRATGAVPFKFRSVYLARLKSRLEVRGPQRNQSAHITATVTKTGEKKLQSNWIYLA